MQWDQAAGMKLFELLDLAIQQESDGNLEMKSVAQAAAQMVVALGVPLESLTSTQQQFLERHRTRGHRKRHGPGFFFIPHLHRKPNIR